MADRWRSLPRPVRPHALWRGDLSTALGGPADTLKCSETDNWAPPTAPGLPPREPAPILPRGSLVQGLPGACYRSYGSRRLSPEQYLPPLPTDTCAPSSCPRPPGRPQPARSVATTLSVSHRERPLSPPPAGARSCLHRPSRSPSAAETPPQGCPLPSGGSSGLLPHRAGGKAGAGPHHDPVTLWGRAARLLLGLKVPTGAREPCSRLSVPAASAGSSRDPKAVAALLPGGRVARSFLLLCGSSGPGWRSLRT